MEDLKKDIIQDKNENKKHINNLGNNNYFGSYNFISITLF